MKRLLKDGSHNGKIFSFPFKNSILYSSLVILFTPIFLLPSFMFRIPQQLAKEILLLSSLIANLGFIYCIIGYHFQILRGDELKLRIHLESLNIAFTTTLVFFFLLIFIFLNYCPSMFNWILVILAVIVIVTYLLATQFIKEKYQ